MSISGFKKVDSMLSTQGSRQKDSLEDSLKDVAQLYEKQFLRHMVAEMRKTVPEIGLLKKIWLKKFFKKS